MLGAGWAWTPDCRRNSSAERSEAVKSSLLNLPLSGTMVRAVMGRPLRFMLALPVAGSGSSQSARFIVSKVWARVEARLITSRPEVLL